MNTGFQGNYIDLLIVLVLAYFAWRSWHSRFAHVLADFSSFTISLLLALSFYQQGADFLIRHFSIAKTIASAVGFLVIAVLSETVLGVFFESIAKRLKFTNKTAPVSLLRVVLGVMEGLVLVAFIVLLTIALPIRPSVKNDLSASKIGGVLIEKGARYERMLDRIFGDAVSETISYLTIDPNRNTTVSLQTEVVKLSEDTTSEREMVTLINFERRNAGLPELLTREELIPIAREHARDMWNRKYFSHYSPEGEDVGDRLDSVGMNYFFAGENLALAPTTQIAHKGLMDSKGHRENILSEDFKQVGVGVIDNGFYGKMFVQIFTD